MTNGGRMGWITSRGMRIAALLGLLGSGGCRDSGFILDENWDHGPRDHGPSDLGPTDSAGWFIGLDGEQFHSSCEAAWIGVDPCGAIDGQPFYGFYDGCNWCVCEGGQFGCTARACASDTDAGVPEGDAGVDDPYAWNAGLCVPYYYGGGPLAPSASEEWVCDDEGRLFRSACVPAAVSAP